MRFATVRKHALSLADVTEEPHHTYGSFRVRGRIFVTVPPEETTIHVFVDEEERERALAMHPEWATKLMWGKKALGVRVDLAAAPAAAVKALVAKAHEARGQARSAARRRSAA
jgi:hypothetical protein